MNNVNSNVNNVTSIFYDKTGFLQNLLSKFNGFNYKDIRDFTSNIVFPRNFVSKFPLSQMKKYIYDDYTQCFEMKENFKYDYYIHFVPLCRKMNDIQIILDEIIRQLNIHISLHQGYKFNPTSLSKSIHIKVGKYTLANFGISKTTKKIKIKQFSSNSILDNNLNFILSELRYIKKDVEYNYKIHIDFNQYVNCFVTLLYIMVFFVVFIFEDAIEEQSKMLEESKQNISKKTFNELMLYSFFLHKKIEEKTKKLMKNRLKNIQEQFKNSDIKRLFILQHKNDILKRIKDPKNRYYNELPESIKNIYIPNYEYTNNDIKNFVKNLQQNNVNEIFNYMINSSIKNDDNENNYELKRNLANTFNIKISDNNINNYTVENLYKKIKNKNSFNFDNYSLEGLFKKFDEIKKYIRLIQQRRVFQKYKNEFEPFIDFIKNQIKHIEQLRKSYDKLERNIEEENLMSSANTRINLSNNNNK